MNWIDLFIIALIGFSVIVSLMRGFAREALSLINLVASIFIALQASGWAAEWLAPYIVDAHIRTPVAFALVFFGCLLCGSLINYMVSKIIYMSGLTGIDRLLGIVFGLLRGSIVVVAIVIVMNFTPIKGSEPWKNSLLLPMFNDISQKVAKQLPNFLSDFEPDNHIIPIHKPAADLLPVNPWEQVK